jgi:hypothetical protein
MNRFQRLAMYFIGALMGFVIGGGALYAADAEKARASDQAGWKKHTVATGFHNNTAVAGDFTGDGKVDVITSGAAKVSLFVAPDWKEVIVFSLPKGKFLIHSEVLDVDGDGDLDYIGTRYKPGWIFWLEQPANPLTEPWVYHLVDDKINGIHGVLVGDVDGDGKGDLLANSAQAKDTDYPESLVWYKVPKKPRSAKRWHRHVFADKDAPGLTHYLGMGDVNGDGRADGASGAKGAPAPAGVGDWFAWWEAPKDPTKPWTKHLIADKQLGATNIFPADINGDGKVDFLASRGHGKGVVWFEAPHWKPHEIHATLAGPHCLQVVDMDGDGDIDAATCAKDDKLAVWFENDGKGQFTTHIVGRQQSAYDIRAVDMDGDGDLDLLIAGRDTLNVVWYENPVKK